MCPYLVRNKLHVQKNIPLEETDYIETVIEVDIWNYAECEKEKCGVWSEGRCRYNEQR